MKFHQVIIMNNYIQVLYQSKIKNKMRNIEENINRAKKSPFKFCDAKIFFIKKKMQLKRTSKIHMDKIFKIKSVQFT